MAARRETLPAPFGALPADAHLGDGNLASAVAIDEILDSLLDEAAARSHVARRVAAAMPPGRRRIVAASLVVIEGELSRRRNDLPKAQDAMRPPAEASALRDDGRELGTPWRWIARVASSATGAGEAYRGVLGIRDARALIAASAASQHGDWLYNAALLGYVYAATGSAAWVGAATICRLLPYVLLGPVGGAIADRFPRRTVLVAGDVLRLALMLGLVAVVAAAGPVEVVIALTVLASAAGSAERPAALALMPRLVGESRLGAANALLHTVQELGVVVGPAIGAILLAAGPSWLAFAVNAATFAASGALVATIRDRSRPARVRGSTTAQVAYGLRTARTTAFVVPLFVLAATVEFTYGAQTVQLVVYAERSLGLGNGGYGVLLTALGVGGVLSALVNARLAAARRVALVVVATAVATSATQLVLAGSSVLAIALAAVAIGGGALVSCEVVAETALARTVPAEALGRVVGVFDAASVGAMVAGAVLAPIAIAATSLSASFLVLGGASIAVALLGRIGLRGLDAANALRSDELASRIGVIERLPMAEALPRTIVERLAAASQLCALPAGVDVVVQGAPAHALFAIVDGAAVVQRNGLRVDRMGPGEVFGERGLLDNAPRNATVTTDSDATLLRIDGEALIEAVQAVPAMRPALDVGGRGRDDRGTSASARTAASLDTPAAIDGATVVVGRGLSGEAQDLRAHGAARRAARDRRRARSLVRTARGRGRGRTLARRNGHGGRGPRRPRRPRTCSAAPTSSPTAS